MSALNTKVVLLNVKELLYKSEQIIQDLTRYLSEALPQIEITRNGSELTIITPQKMSKRVIRLRIRKFLYRKALSEDYRPVSFKEADKDGNLKDGYIIKEKKLIELSYY